MQCSAKENKNIEEIFQNLLGTFYDILDESIKRGLVKSGSQVNKAPTTKPDNIILKN
jgi:hypothetical protein